MRRTGALPLVVTVVLAVGWLTYTLTLGGHSPQLGLDLQGGTSVVLAAKAGQNVTSGQLDQAISIIRRRVDGLGVAEPEITRQGNFIVVSLPGVKDSQRAIDLVGRTAKLQFRPTCTQLPPNLPDSTYQSALDPSSTGLCVRPSNFDPTQVTTTTGVPSPGSSSVSSSSASSSASGSSLGLPLVAGHAGAPQSSSSPGASSSVSSDSASSSSASSSAGETTTTTTGGATTTTAPAASAPCGSAGERASITDDTQPIIATEDRGKTGNVDVCDVLGPVAMSGDGVSNANAVIPEGTWKVQLNLKSSGLDQFNKMSQHCYSKDTSCPGGSTAIVLDGNVESNPVPQTPTFNSTAIEITGNFDQKKAEDLALVLNYGALPIQLEQQRVETVSATLGRDSLRAGLIAGLVGVVAVAIYMILYYRALGVVVVLGLAVWSALNYSIITALSGSSGLALSLAGVTGIVVSVGVTTDSYIVYFERMKDEVKSGKTVRSAVDHAFKRAWRTIVAADLASLIGAVVLWWLTVGAVRGFAFFLGLSTMLDLFTAYFFKRPMVALLARSRFLTEARWIGVRSGLAAADLPSAAPAATGR